MELLKVAITNESRNTKRLTGIVNYDDGFEEEYWFEVPSDLEISISGNPWVACLLPLAVTLGEDLYISLPVDPRLMDATEDLVRLWHGWYPKLSIISVIAKNGTGVIENQPTESATFFSSGVDSFFTAYRRPRARNMILVQGFDMPVSKTDAFKLLCERISEIVANLGAKFIPVVTNIRETRWKNANWEALAYGPALAAVALIFERQFHEVFVPSSHDYANLFPWASHPLSDPLFSTTKTNIIHEGSGFTRFEKIQYISQYDLALNGLHVCFRGQDSLGQDETNCCRCEKCYRTMIALELIGKLDKSRLFDRTKFTVEDISKIYASSENDQMFLIEMAETARKKGRDDIAIAIDKCLRRSKWLNFVSLFSRIPFLWRISHKIMDRAKKNSFV